jgi:dipeptidyl-peptidase-4
MTLVVASAPVTPAYSQQKQRLSTLDDAQQASVVLAGRGMPRGIAWLGSGDRYAFIATNPRTNRLEVHVFDPATGGDSAVVAPDELRAPATTQPFEYRSIQYSRDASTLVFQTNFRPIFRRSGISDFYLYSLADHSFRIGGRDARTAELSPDGKTLGEERGGDLYVVDLAAGRERRLTHDATEHVFNGHFDWVYEEEFGLSQAWQWSPDSRRIAYWQVDERLEPETRLTDYSGRHPTWTTIRYPMPGDSNPKVRIGVADVRDGRTIWLDPGVRGDYYIPRIFWTSRRDTLAMLVLDRPQRTLKVLFFDVRTGGHREVMTETSSSWIDVFGFFGSVEMMTFPPGLQEFLWISDRDGFPHIYRYDYSGSVTRIEGVDAARRLIYFTSTNPSPLQRQLWQVSVDGGGLRRITTAGGFHQINMSPDTRHFVDAWSSTTQPRQVELWSTTSGRLRTLETNAATSEWLATHDHAPTELFTVTTADGVRLDASMIKPVPFDSTRRYPVIFTVYGGVGSQGVYDQFGTLGWNQWLAQQGFVVVDVNGRGSGNYGAEFMRVVYRQLGRYESLDYAEVAKHLRKLPYVDGDHIGIMGTSNGGYLTMYTMEMYPDIFRVGISNSGVADWRLYDTIISERFMSQLGDNPDGYERSSVVMNAARLQGHLLLVHSMMDDNVHPDNTMQLLTAFADRGKDVEQRIYPPGRHGASYSPETVRLMRAAEFEFLSRWLRAR